MVSPPMQPLVTIRQGTYIGTTFKGDFSPVLDAFYGIPYALPTSGDRRFRPPVPLHTSADTFEASVWGQRPPTMPMFGAEDLEPEGEDCLNLNIFRPQLLGSSKKLPVVIVFNGGAFNLGSAKMRQLSNLVGWSGVPILGVSFNYRIGALGFLPSKLMAQEDCLNLGLKDQKLLLEWVQENIGAFGGDASDVTALGYSAGAHSIGHHMLNPDSNAAPLFHKVIMESGAPTARFVFPYDHSLHEAQFQDFLTKLDAQNLTDEKIIPFLQSLPFEKIRDASVEIFFKYSPSMQWPFQPTIDGPGGIIPISPIEAWTSKKRLDIPILTGFCTNEGTVFVPSQASTDAQFTNWFRTLLPHFSSNDLAALKELYPDPVSNPASPYLEKRRNLGKQYTRFDAAYSHFAYIAPVRQTAHIVAASSASPSASPVYLYEFGVIKNHSVGARHSDHTQHTDYLADVTGASPTNKAIAAAMNAYWTSFIATGDPNTVPGLAPERPAWKPYREDETGVGLKMALGVGNDEIAGGSVKGVVAEMRKNDAGQKECGFWWSKVAKFEPKPLKL